jgi:hypothetical protein
MICNTDTAKKSWDNIVRVLEDNRKYKHESQFLLEHPCGAHIRHQLVVIPERLYDLPLSFGIMRIHRNDRLAPRRLFTRGRRWGYHRDGPINLRVIPIKVTALRVPTATPGEAKSRAKHRAHVAHGHAHEATQVVHGQCV